MKQEYLSILLEKRDALLSDKRKAREFWRAWKQLTGQLPADDAKEVLTAIHEAGHAVMHWIVDAQFKNVTIVPKDGCLGYVSGGYMDISGLDFTFPVRTSTARFMDRLMIIYLAGYAAESVYLRPKKPDSNKTDFTRVSDLCSYRFLSRKEERAHVNEMVQNATDLIARHWLQVVILAIELLEKKTVEYEEAISLRERMPHW